MIDVHFTIDVPRGRQRFRELIIYVASKSADDPHFGATKLNKILFYADMAAFERFGEPLTGMAYFRLDRGPAPMALKPIQRDLEQEGAIAVFERSVGNRQQIRTVAKREPDTDLFTDGELRLVDEIIASFEGMTADEASARSHKIAWHVLSDRERIPYEAAFLSDDEPTVHDVAEARELNERYGWGLRV
ncbi:MAG TPA: Panacea domain-containing protein [Allosphingosinicella sp.]|jgi:hypothetical protein